MTKLILLGKKSIDSFQNYLGTLHGVSQAPVKSNWKRISQVKPAYRTVLSTEAEDYGILSLKH